MHNSNLQWKFLKFLPWKWTFDLFCWYTLHENLKFTNNYVVHAKVVPMILVNLSIRLFPPSHNHILLGYSEWRSNQSLCHTWREKKRCPRGSSTWTSCTVYHCEIQLWHQRKHGREHCTGTILLLLFINKPAIYMWADLRKGATFVQTSCNFERLICSETTGNQLSFTACYMFIAAWIYLLCAFI